MTKLYIKDGVRFNIYIPRTINGEKFGANAFERQETRDRFGVLEMDEPTPPADYSEDLYYRTEQDETPYVVYTRKSDEQIAGQGLAKAQAKAAEYLRSTDWYVTRLAETGKAIPEEVLTGRAEARLVL